VTCGFYDLIVGGRIYKDDPHKKYSSEKSLMGLNGPMLDV
jgi:hypothetical protein